MLKVRLGGVLVVVKSQTRLNGMRSWMNAAAALPRHLSPASLNALNPLPPPQRPDLSPDQRKVLAIMARTFGCYITEDPRAADLKEKLNRWGGGGLVG
jgi:hypothetical protein